MSLANLKRMKKELLLINKKNNINKFIIQALDGLFLIDLSKIDEGRVTQIEEAPEGMNVESIAKALRVIFHSIGEDESPEAIYEGMKLEEAYKILGWN